MRSKKRAFVCDSSDGPHHFHRSYLESVLADRSIISVSDAPRVASKDSRLPLGRRNVAFLFVRQVHSGFLAYAENPGIFLKVCHAQAALVAISPTDSVKIHVRGNCQGFLHIGPAMSLPILKYCLLVLEIRVWDRNRAGRENLLGRVNDAFSQGSYGKDRFYYGPRSVKSGCGSVQENFSF